jgi:hypothetical protein
MKPEKERERERERESNILRKKRVPWGSRSRELVETRV